MLQLLVLVRFICFVALVYLSLHVIFAQLISKSDSKVLWFFSVVTAPLTWPVRTWIVPNASESRLRLAALVMYGLIWVLAVVLMNVAVSASG